MLRSLIWLFLGCSSAVISAPYHGTVMQFEQPDGSYVSVKIYGDEYYCRGESMDGYTLVRDPESGWICYATLSDDGSELVSTGIHYTGDDAAEALKKSVPSLPKHLDLEESIRMKIVHENFRKLNLEQAGGESKAASQLIVEGDIKEITLLVDFSDYPASLPASVFDSLCNGRNFDLNVWSVRSSFL